MNHLLTIHQNSHYNFLISVMDLKVSDVSPGMCDTKLIVAAFKVRSHV